MDNWCGTDLWMPPGYEEGRSKFLKRCFQLKFDGGIVEKALYLFDRFVRDDEHSWTLDESSYQLGLTVSLMTISKLYEVPNPMTITTISNASGIDKGLLIWYEHYILKGANFMVSKPTISVFYLKFRKVLPPFGFATNNREQPVAEVLLEVVLKSKKFAFARPSAVALAVLHLSISMTTDSSVVYCPYRALADRVQGLPTLEDYELMKHLLFQEVLAMYA